MRNLLITGASGMVGYAMCRVAIDQGFLVIGIARNNRHALPNMRFDHVDLLSSVDLSSALEYHQPEIVVHLAANTDHTACERDPEYARKLHVDASSGLAAASYKFGSRFIHVSTEAVYGNLGPGLRVETDTCEPDGVYASTKLEGEIQVMIQHPGALVLRVTPVGYAPDGMGSTLVEWLIGQLGTGQSITGYTDVHFTPVSSFSLARLILNPRLEGVHGIYNWGNNESLSKYEFALQFAASLGYGTDTIRPGNRNPGGKDFHGGMDSRSLSQITGIPQPATAELIADLMLNCQLTQHH